MFWGHKWPATGVEVHRSSVCIVLGRWALGLLLYTHEDLWWHHQSFLRGTPFVRERFDELLYSSVVYPVDF